MKTSLGLVKALFYVSEIGALEVYLDTSSLRKGTDFEIFDVLLNRLCHDLDCLGYRRICLRSDNDAGLCKLLKCLKERWSGESLLEQTPEGDHNSNGSGECAVGLIKGHIRSVKIGLEGKLKCEIPETHPLMTWITAFVGSSYRRYHIGRDGKTPSERIL